MDDVESAWGEGCARALVVCPGGGGKTVVGSQLIVNELAIGGRALVLTNRKKLSRQFRDTIVKKFHAPCCLEMSGKRWQGSPVLSATVQTMATEIKKGRFTPDQFTLLVIDEADESFADTFLSCLEFFKGAKVVGFTATDYRSDQKDLMKLYDKRIERVTMPELIEKGFLSPLTIENIPIKIKLNKSGSGDFTDEEVSHAIEPYLEALADEVLKRSKDRCCLMFLPLISTSHYFSRLLNDRGLRAEHVDGTMKEGDINDAIERLESRQIDCLCCSMLLSRGVDIPPVSLIGMFRATVSWSHYVQSAVRGTRLHKYTPEKPWPDKSDCILLDPLWLCNQHNLIQTPACIATHDAEDREYINQKIAEGNGLDLMQLRTEAQNAREQALRERLEEMSKRKARLINAVDFFKSIGKQTEYLNPSNTRWDNEQVTPGQKAVLEKNGFDLDEITTRSQASKIMDEIMLRVKAGLCTFPQIQKIKDLGNKDDNFSLTFTQASELIHSLENIKINHSVN